VQVGTYGDPGRDPRGWTVTVAYAAVVPSTELGVKAAVRAATQGNSNSNKTTACGAAECTESADLVHDGLIAATAVPGFEVPT
jgi:ADP-ribose pyrophosphatase YjhB (NUDIX family)